jgi:hypothetical protein
VPHRAPPKERSFSTGTTRIVLRDLLYDCFLRHSLTLTLIMAFMRYMYRCTCMCRRPAGSANLKLRRLPEQEGQEAVSLLLRRRGKADANEAEMLRYGWATCIRLTIASGHYSATELKTSAQAVRLLRPLFIAVCLCVYILEHRFLQESLRRDAYRVSHQSRGGLGGWEGVCV